MSEYIICAVINSPCDQTMAGKCNVCPHARSEINSLLDNFVSGHENAGRRDIKNARGATLRGLQTRDIGVNSQQIEVQIKKGVMTVDIYDK